MTAKGFVYMDTPGYDPVSATGQVAGGANMICFTTGRGSAYGCAPAPSLKLADEHGAVGPAGRGHRHQLRRDRRRQRTVAEIGERFFQLILDIASGAKSRANFMATDRTNSSRGIWGR